MPFTVPPRTWPASVIGLTMVPQSVDRHVVEEVDLSGLYIHLDHRDVTHVADDRVEDAEVGTILRRHGRDRMVVDVGRVDAAGEVVILRQAPA